MEFEESGILDTCNKHAEIINDDENQSNKCNQTLACNDSVPPYDDSMQRTLQIPKVSKKLDYQEFSSILNQLFNACERNSDYATLVSGMVLKLLLVVDKHESETEISDSIEDNLTNIFLP